MNHFLPARYDEDVGRLALGLEVLDAQRGGRVALPVSVAFDGLPLPLPPSRAPRRVGGLEIFDVQPRAVRHDSCLFTVLYTRNLYRPVGGSAKLKLRLVAPGRRFVPRRLSFPLADPAAAQAFDESEVAPGNPALLGIPNRVRSVSLFPGAAYDAPATVTALRGRCRRADGSPVRWVRVEARLPPGRGGQPGAVVGRAQGDDRGEFLLLVGSEASGIGPLDAHLQLTLTVTAFAQTAPPPATPLQRANDPLWDLPLEAVTGPGPGDPVGRGEALPTGYGLSRSQSVLFQLGRTVTSAVPPFVF